MMDILFAALYPLVTFGVLMGVDEHHTPEWEDYFRALCWPFVFAAMFGFWITRISWGKF